MSPDDSYPQYLQQAQSALKAGDLLSARHFAQKAAQLAPEKEDPWLILAAVASPRASLEYLKRALEINPDSLRARKGMHWAIQRLRTSQTNPSPPPGTQVGSMIAQPAREALVQKQSASIPWFFAVMILTLGVTLWFIYPMFSTSEHTRQPLALAQRIEKATRTSLPTDAPTATLTPPPLPTATDTPTALPTATDTATPLPTDTPLPVPTDSNEASQEPEPTRGPDGQRGLPDVEPGERWIDVDLSQQRVFAYEGDQIVNIFRVSTGTSQTPTITGQYKIYVKYRAANMSGPGYFLPDVPYVMYFYKGYGLHGTYWHSNFGTPMSHGCVNLKTKEAKWLFDWASVGTVVYVHR